MAEGNMLTRTRSALGEDLMKQINSLRFCIVGCGGTGATFAEMLVRSGARNVGLIDGEKIEPTNLNRTFSFASEDVVKKKTEVLKKKLDSIVLGISIRSFPVHLRSTEDILDGNFLAQEARDCVYKSDVVFIGTDTNKSRIVCEDLCNNKSDKMYLSCGIGLKNGKSFFECTWKPKTSKEKENEKGYGPENASYISIVMEATSVAFSMLLHHLKNPRSSRFNYYYREYDADFMVSETETAYQKNLQLQ